MAERIIRPITKDGKVTVPKKLREKYRIKDYVVFVESDEGILIKPLD
jgi:AbrB family looped-hinge helix DNA binding protein